jgi:hypothetical protein
VCNCFTTASAILLGTAGFLPLSPSEAHLGDLSPEEVSAIDAAWLARGSPWHGEVLSPSSWRLARVRPANHPVPRLLAAASILTAASQRGGLLATVLDLLVTESDLVPPFRAVTAHPSRVGIGEDRALDILSSAVVPLALAIANYAGDLELAEATSRHWERLPAPAANAVTRRAVRQVAGGTPLGRIGARGAQGLIHLDTTLCQPRRCFECPVAMAELSVNGSSPA